MIKTEQQRDKHWPVWLWLLIGIMSCGNGQQQSNTAAVAVSDTDQNSNVQTEKAILAGGCFWGMEELIRHQPGVTATIVGYTGGDVPNATYRNHGNHAEGILVTFDPAKLSYRKLLEYFFRIHDPSTVDRQGNDIGSSYRSAIFYLNEGQREIAEKLIAEMDKSGKWPGKIVTEVKPAGEFWKAEEEHQNYLQKHPFGYTCHYERKNWKVN